MKRGTSIILFLLVIVLFIFVAFSYSSFDNSSPPLTAHASSQQATVGLTIEGEGDASPPPSEGEGSGGSSGGSGGGGGGGGGGAAVSGGAGASQGGTGSGDGFEVTPEEFNFKSIIGEETVQEFTISNTGLKEITISIAVRGIGTILHLDTNEITLSPGQERTIVATIIPNELGVFGGRLIFESGSVRKDVLLIVNVWTTDSLFDVSLEIPSFSKIVQEGENLEAFISLLQVGPASKVDVTATYIIKDFDGNILFEESETFFVEESKDLSKEFIVSDLTPGDYVLAIEIAYPDGFASASSQFSVERDQNYSLVLILIIIGWIIVLAIIIFFIYFFFFKNRKKQEQKKGART